MIAIFNYVRYQYRKDLMKIGIENQRVNNGISHNYVNYLKDQSNYVVQQNLNIELEQNYSDYQRIYLSQAKFNSGFNFCENLFQKIIYLTIIMLGCYLIIDHKTLNIGELTFLVSLISMAMSAINGICDFVVKGNEYTQMSEIYQNFITLENRSNKTGTKINQIKNIKIHGKTIQSGETLLNNDEILDIITLEKEKNDLEINNIHCDLISQTDYLSKMFVININTKISKD
jgi:ABC-type bacteriocin/lantibiotic exporter with double-glycine peptidase domain